MKYIVYIKKTILFPDGGGNPKMVGIHVRPLSRIGMQVEGHS